MKKILCTLCVIAGFFMNGYCQDNLQQYTGKYNFCEGSLVREITVTFENNLLQACSFLGVVSLVKYGEDNFTMPALNGTAMFKRDGNKKINNLSIDLMGLKLEGTKEAEAASGPGTSTDKPIIIIWERKFLTATP
ncbi:MAG: hypothetical protein ABIX01_10420 [Chitinophagaceae bacterium]